MSCQGRMFNTEGKRRTKCSICGNISFEANEGDRCTMDDRRLKALAGALRKRLPSDWNGGES